MKTFKLCSLLIQVSEEEQPLEIALLDGLIINKEEVQKNWLIEAVVKQHDEQLFAQLFTNDQKFMVEATITKKTNTPATFICTVKSVKRLTTSSSILLDGLLVVREEDFSDMVLRSLIGEGVMGEALLDEFKKRKRDRGRAIQGVLDNAFVQSKGKFFE